jgi:hypothetical protein
MRLTAETSLAFALLALASAAVKAAVPVYGGGRALLPVILAADAIPEERAAASELARALGRMSGLAWPVHPETVREESGFYVGRTRAAVALGVPLRPAADLLAPKAREIGPDGFRICTRGESVFIEGATPGATEFGVSWLLQHEAGVRWYSPGSIGEVMPHRTQWSLPELDIVREPAYVSREIYALDTQEEKEWARRNGLMGRLEFSHALVRVFPANLLAAHKQWAPLLDGSRYVPASADDYNWQPNLALEEVSAKAGEAAVAAFARDPLRPSFSLAINDSIRFDQSDATLGLVGPLRYFRGKPDYSPLVFSFMNRAAKSLGSEGPGRYLGCLAYFWCENAPPFPVDPRIVPYVTADRTQYFDSSFRTGDLALMSRWGASGVKAFGLWEYGYGRDFLVPRVPDRVLAEAVREGWRRGARGYFAEINPQWGFDAFKAWMLAQLLWEPERPYEELAADFFSGYYGAAADPMRRFFDRCEEQWMAQPGPPYWLKYYRQDDQALLFPPGVCRELRGFLDAAARAARSDSVVAARVSDTSQAFSVAEAYVSFDAARRHVAGFGADSFRGGPGGEAEAAESIRSLAERRTALEAASRRSRGDGPEATAGGVTANLLRNDPVPRLLWLAGERDSASPGRILAAAGPLASGCEAWSALAAVIAAGRLAGLPELEANGSFMAAARGDRRPRFLYPHFGALPAGWIVRAMPTENGRVALVDPVPGGPRRAVRIEGAWDTQVFQWLPATPKDFYVATARLRGKSSPGNDSALYLSFLPENGNAGGTRFAQALPKGSSDEWRTMALAAPAPAGCAWVGVGIASSRQVSGDWLEAAALELRGVKP